MSESASLDEFIRHLQTELEACENITDKVERQKRMWQVEATLLEAIEFQRKFGELVKIGKEPMKIIEAMTMPEKAAPKMTLSAIAKIGGLCPSCGASVESELDFCSSCGEYFD
ncbi:MAG: hypothetical protein QGI21_02700 [Candidatus Poseidoniaceae archaeon]|jgi:hypothetical protein|nr:hypothetical protein [Candidatus Poseidoniaceae archaeon]